MSEAIRIVQNHLLKGALSSLICESFKGDGYPSVGVNNLAVLYFFLIDCYVLLYYYLNNRFVSTKPMRVVIIKLI